MTRVGTEIGVALRILLTSSAEIKEAFILGAAVIGPTIRMILTIIAEGDLTLTRGGTETGVALRILLTIGAEVKEAFILSGAAVIGPAIPIILTIIAEGDLALTRVGTEIGAAILIV